MVQKKEPVRYVNWYPSEPNNHRGTTKTWYNELLWRRTYTCKWQMAMPTKVIPTHALFVWEEENTGGRPDYNCISVFRSDSGVCHHCNERGAKNAAPADKPNTVHVVQASNTARQIYRWYRNLRLRHRFIVAFSNQWSCNPRRWCTCKCLRGVNQGPLWLCKLHKEIKFNSRFHKVRLQAK